MPQEDRKIIFDFQELYKAIYALSMRWEKKLPPPGVIVKIETHASDDGTLIVYIKNDHHGDLNKEEYTHDFLAAALMLFCRSCEVPVPKQSRKSVELKAGAIVLRVQI